MDDRLQQRLPHVRADGAVVRSTGGVSGSLKRYMQGPPAPPHPNAQAMDTMIGLGRSAADRMLQSYQGAKRR